MFEHPRFDHFAFEAIPPRRDLMLMDECWIPALEKEYLRFFAGGDGRGIHRVGYICPVSLEAVDADAAELVWYLSHHRFHQLPILVPRGAFVACIEAQNCDDTPRIFVRSGWIQALCEQPCAAFALVDAIGIRRGMRTGAVSRDALRDLRDRIDTPAARYPDVGFVSFADSVLIKQVWTIGSYGRPAYTYNPEALLPIVAQVRQAFREVLGLNAYAVMSQGQNAYEDPKALHVSPAGNHVSFNTLATPFADLIEIDQTVRQALRSGVHAPADLYLDARFYRSLQFRPDADRDRYPAFPFLPHAEGREQRYHALSQPDLDAMLVKQG